MALLGYGHQLANSESWPPIESNESEPFEQVRIETENKRYAGGILRERTGVLVD